MRIVRFDANSVRKYYEVSFSVALTLFGIFFTLIFTDSRATAEDISNTTDCYEDDFELGNFHNHAASDVFLTKIFMYVTALAVLLYLKFISKK